MTTVATRPAQYGWIDGVLWRDTGLHVLALPGTPGTEVQVLGGGGALIWRLLTQPRTVDDLTALLSAKDNPPDAEAVTRCLDDLTTRGLVVASAPPETVTP